MKKIIQKASERLNRKLIRELYSRKKSTHDNFIRTEGVSFPRSGHGALHDILKVYFGANFIYCAGQGKENCGCGTIPCANPHLLFSKNHDFDVLKDEGSIIIPKQHYIVQYRNPIKSIISDYKIFLATNPNENAKKYWFPFAHNKMKYWMKFVDKWAIEIQSEDKYFLPISYEQLITSPEQTVSDVVHFITQQESDKVKLQKAITGANLKPRNRSGGFQFYDKDFFLELESLAGDRLKKLSLPSFEDSL